MQAGLETGEAKPMARRTKPVKISPLEHEVLKIVWAKGEVRADDIQRQLLPRRKLKDSTVRTLLRRLKAKGVLEHRVEGRTFIWSAPVEKQHLAVNAVRQVIDQFCSGSAGTLLMEMANDDIISADELRELAKKIQMARKGKREK
jgi:BlaI family transcriptional regulator, penicillinase repressor